MWQRSFVLVCDSHGKCNIGELKSKTSLWMLKIKEFRANNQMKSTTCFRYPSGASKIVYRKRNLRFWDVHFILAQHQCTLCN